MLLMLLDRVGLAEHVFVPEIIPFFLTFGLFLQRTVHKIGEIRTPPFLPLIDFVILVYISRLPVK